MLDKDHYEDGCLGLVGGLVDWWIGGLVGGLSSVSTEYVRRTGIRMTQDEDQECGLRKMTQDNDQDDDEERLSTYEDPVRDDLQPGVGEPWSLGTHQLEATK